jgi:hypothetical protein
MSAKWVVSSGVLVLAGLVGAPAVARADTHVGIGIVFSGDHGYRDSRSAFQYGLERGRSEGAERGYRDGRRCNDASFWRDSAYRDADRGYRGWMGPRWDYEAGYRRGFEGAYRQAYASARPGWRDHRDGDRWNRDDRYRGDARIYEDPRRDSDDWRR